MRLTGPLAGEGIRRGVLKVRQYCCSGVRRVEGSEASFTCCRGRTGAAMVMCGVLFQTPVEGVRVNGNNTKGRDRTSWRAQRCLVVKAGGSFFCRSKKFRPDWDWRREVLGPEAERISRTAMPSFQAIRLQGCKAVNNPVSPQSGNFGGVQHRGWTAACTYTPYCRSCIIVAILTAHSASIILKIGVITTFC